MHITAAGQAALGEQSSWAARRGTLQACSPRSSEPLQQSRSSHFPTAAAPTFSSVCFDLVWPQHQGSAQRQLKDSMMSRDISKLKLAPYSSVSSVLCYQGAVAVLTYPQGPSAKRHASPHIFISGQMEVKPPAAARSLSPQPAARLPGLLPDPHHVFSQPSPPTAARQPGGAQLDCKHAVTPGQGAKDDF